MNDAEINDVRTKKDFKGITFSNFQKQKVKTELINCLLSCKVEHACYWGSEFICAGQFIDLWEIIITFFSKYIHLGSPKLPIYISNRFNTFKVIVENGYLDNELPLRNNKEIRILFAEILSVLCFSRKKHKLEQIKINKEDFDMFNISSKLKAPKLSFGEKIVNKDDPKELFIAVNEFAYDISKQTSNAVSGCYWIEWVMEFEQLCKRRKETCLGSRRTFSPILEKYQKDPIWIIWECILNECKERNNLMLEKVMSSLLEIFCIKYTNASNKRRRFVLYFAVSLLTETVEFNINVVNNIDAIKKVTQKIDNVYKDVKKNEQAPKTNYLLNGINPRKTNLEKTIQRLEKMNSIL